MNYRTMLVERAADFAANETPRALSYDEYHAQQDLQRWRTRWARHHAGQTAANNDQEKRIRPGREAVARACAINNKTIIEEKPNRFRAALTRFWRKRNSGRA